MKQKTLIYSYIISIIINLSFIISLSFFPEHRFIKAKNDDDVNIHFVSLSKGKFLQNQSENITDQTDQYSNLSSEINSGNTKYLTTRTYRTIIRELTAKNQKPSFIKAIDEFNLNNHSSRLSRKDNINDFNSKPIFNNKNLTDIVNKIEGSYNIPLIRYKDDSDDLSKNAIYQLANAINRWTKIKTNVIEKPIRLDDSKFTDIPFAYVVFQKPFAFSDNERQNLRRFFSNGGFLMISNVGKSDTQRLEIANSIGFELWKILGESAHDLMEIDEDNVLYNSFFSIRKSAIPEILGLSIKGRIIAIYEDSGYNIAWNSGKNEPYLEMGINIIIYALATNPYIFKEP